MLDCFLCRRGRGDDGIGKTSVDDDEHPTTRERRGATPAQSRKPRCKRDAAGCKAPVARRGEAMYAPLCSLLDEAHRVSCKFLQVLGRSSASPATSGSRPVLLLTAWDASSAPGAEGPRWVIPQVQRRGRRTVTTCVTRPDNKPFMPHTILALGSCRNGACVVLQAILASSSSSSFTHIRSDVYFFFGMGCSSLFFIQARC